MVLWQPWDWGRGRSSVPRTQHGSSGFTLCPGRCALLSCLPWADSKLPPRPSGAARSSVATPGAASAFCEPLSAVRTQQSLALLSAEEAPGRPRPRGLSISGACWRRRLWSLWWWAVVRCPLGAQGSRARWHPPGTCWEGATWGAGPEVWASLRSDGSRAPVPSRAPAQLPGLGCGHGSGPLVMADSGGHHGSCF